MDEEYYNWIHSSDFTESDARDEGYRAYLKGLSSYDNPFNNNDEWELHLSWEEVLWELHLAWEEGLSSAAWDD